MMNTIFKALSILAVYFAINQINGAEILLQNGQSLSGIIIQNDSNEVVIGLGVEGKQGRLVISADQVLKIIRNLPDLEQGDTKPQAVADGSKYYAKIRVDGVIGESIFAEGLREALQLAKKRDINHIILEINNDIANRSGDIDETDRVSKILSEFKEVLSYHVLVKNCRGLDLVFPIHSHTLNLQTGGVLCGNQSSADNIQTLRTDLAHKARVLAKRNGKFNTAYAAMMDPREGLCLWLDDEDVVQVSSQVPEGVNENKIISSNEYGVTQIDDVHFKEANMVVVKNVKELLTTLGIEDLKPTGDIDRAFVNGNQKAIEKKNNKQNELQQRIDKNIQRRHNAAEVMAYSIEQAKKYDPVNKNYATVGSWEDQYWSYNGSSIKNKSPYRASDYLGPKQFTPDSLNKWRQYSDLSIRYLSDAIKAATLIQEIERDNQKLGVELIYEEIALKNIIDSLKTNLHLVLKNRNKAAK